MAFGLACMLASCGSKAEKAPEKNDKADDYSFTIRHLTLMSRQIHRGTVLSLIISRLKVGKLKTAMTPRIDHVCEYIG